MSAARTLRNKEIARARGWRDIGGYYRNCKGNPKPHFHGFPPDGNIPMCVPNFLAKKKGNVRSATKKR